MGGRHTHTQSKKDCNAMQPGRGNREALGSKAVTEPEEGKKEKREFPGESWVTLVFPRSTFHPGSGS